MGKKKTKNVWLYRDIKFFIIIIFNVIAVIHCHENNMSIKYYFKHVYK